MRFAHCFASLLTLVSASVGLAGGELAGLLPAGGQASQYTGEAVALKVDLTETPTLTGEVTSQAGETWRFQLWFRDVNPNWTSNFTDATAITVL